MPRKPFPLHPLLFAAFPVLFLFWRNIGTLAPAVVLLPLGISVGAAAVLFLLLNVFIRDSAKAALAASGFIILFYLFGHVYPFIKLPPFGPWLARFHVKTHIFLLSVWAAVFLLGAFFILKTRKELHIATAFFNAVGAFLIIIPLLNIGIYEFGGYGAANEVNRIKKVSGTKTALPDIYFIIVDAYAGQDTLQNLYGYDNSEFLDYLAGKGFYVVPRARANYCRTTLSLASTLNLDYIDTLMGSRFNPESADIAPVDMMLKHSGAAEFLKERGYKTIAFADWYAETDMNTADIYMADTWALDEFRIMLLKTTPVPALLKTFGLSDKLTASFRKRVFYKLDHLAGAARGGAPAFVFCHIEAPHPPFVFAPDREAARPAGWANDDEGNWMLEEGALSKEGYIKGYVGQITYINTRLKTILDALLSDPAKKPVIILQADHGPRSKLFRERSDETSLRECFSILNACYLPDGGNKLLYEGVTPVNTFRIIFNYYFGTDYPMREDRSFFSTAKHPYRFTEFTEEAHKR